MGFSHTIHAFRYTDIERFKTALEQTADKHHGKFIPKQSSENPENELLVGLGPKAITLFYRRAIFPFMRDVTCALGGVPCMEARIQDGSHWDYSIFRGFEDLDQFSTFPQYWENEEDPITLLANRGNPEMVSLLFDTPVARFEPYLKHWRSGWDSETQSHKHKLKGKAFPSDRCEYGNCEQLWDFLDSIGIHDPASGRCSEKIRWNLILPDKRPVLPRRTWWQRMLNR